MEIMTNIGSMPLEDYLDIQAQQSGFDNYADMQAHGFHSSYSEWEEYNDGWFTYYYNKKTGEKKLHLEEGDVLVPHKLDDLIRTNETEAYM